MQSARSQSSNSRQPILRRYFLHSFPGSFKKSRRVLAFLTACAFLVSQVGYSYAGTTPLNTTVIDDPAMTPAQMQDQQAAQDQTLQGMQAQANAMQPKPGAVIIAVLWITLENGIKLKVVDRKVVEIQDPERGTFTEENAPRLLKAYNTFMGKDHRLGVKELLAGIRGFRGSFASKVGDDRYQEDYDFDRNGKIDFRDYLVLHWLVWHFMSGEERRKLITFLALSGGDGVMTAEEWDAAVKEFGRLSEQRGPDREYNPAFDLNGDGLIDELDDEPFTALFNLLSEEEQLRYRLLQIKAAYAGEDGELSAGEYIAAARAFIDFLLALPPGVYDELWDLNGDGFVNNQDIEPFQGLKSFLSEAEQLKVEAFQEVVDQNKDNVLTAEEMIAALKGFRAALGHRQGDADYDKLYAQYDFNHSGGVAVNDLAILRGLIPLMADPERHVLNAYLTVSGEDMELTAGEVVEALQGLLASWGKEKGQEGYDARYDFDRSGIVGGDDLDIILGGLIPLMSDGERRRLRAFDAMDGNDDWVLTAEEYIAAKDAFEKHLAHGAGAYVEAWDLNGDGTVNNFDIAPFEELLKLLSEEEQLRYKLLQIKAAYAGEDGELSAGEYKAALDAFGKFLVHVPPGAYVEMLDFNGDGKVDLFDIPSLKGLFDFLSDGEKARYRADYRAEEWQEVVKEFVRLLTQSGPGREYNPIFDLNGDGTIDGLDIEPFTVLLGLSSEEQIWYRLLQIKAAYAGEDGELSAEEYMAAARAFTDLLLAPTPDVDVALWDLNGDGFVNNQDIEPFQGLKSFLSEAEQLKVEAFQEVVDQNKDNVLTAEEMIAALKGFRAALGHRQGDADYDKLYAQYDFNHSGGVAVNDLAILRGLIPLMSDSERHVLNAYLTVSGEDLTLTAGEIIHGIETVRSLQLSQKGEPDFNPAYDFNGNGIIMADDTIFVRSLVSFLDEMQRQVYDAYFAIGGQDRQLSAEEMVGALKGLRAALGSQQGDADYDPRYDFNHSGGVAVNDLAILRGLIPLMSGWEQHIWNAYLRVSGGNLKLTASKLRKAIREFRKSFGKEKGQKGYRAKYDFDRSGAVDYRDLLILRHLLSLLRATSLR